MSKCIILNDGNVKFKEYVNGNVRELLGLNDSEILEHYIFGNDNETYTMFFKCVNDGKEIIKIITNEEPPVSIYGKVLILNEDNKTGDFIDINILNINKLKKHFETTNGIWVLTKKYI